MTPYELFEQNQAFAYWVACKYARSNNIEELKQLALTGLFKAALKFDKTKGCRFTTYAFHFIKSEIVRHFETWRSVHVPRQIVEKAGKVEKLDYHTMTVEQIMQATDYSKKEVNAILSYLYLSVVSTESKAYNHDDSETVGETIRSHFQDDWEEQVLIKAFIESLDCEESLAVSMKLQGKSQREIGEALGVTQVTAGRMLKRIKNKYIAYIA